MKTPSQSSIRSSRQRSINPAPQSRAAFTLIEILVVLAIVALLAVLIVPAIQRALVTAKAATTTSNLKTIGSAMALYAADHNQSYPKAAHSSGGGITGLTWWFTDLAPYLSETPYRIAADPQESVLRVPLADVAARGWPWTDFGINGYVLKWSDRDYPAAAIDQPSKTLMVAESPLWCVVGWGGSDLRDDLAFRGQDATHVLFFDGHTARITREQLDDSKYQKELKGLGK